VRFLSCPDSFNSFYSWFLSFLFLNFLTDRFFGMLLAHPFPTVVLKPRKAQPFYGRHPWVLDSAVARILGRAEDGEVVDLQADDGKWIARGIYNGKSRIRVRLYTWDPTEELDGAFWSERITNAWRFREELSLGRETASDGVAFPADSTSARARSASITLHPPPSTHSARMIFSEGDSLSGLIVDRYGDYLVVQVTALAIAMRLPLVIKQLVELAQPRGILLRTERDIVRAEGFELPSEPLAWGELPPGPIEIVDRGLRFAVDLSSGQKTGFYLDQRDNRYAAAGYLKGRKVLDMFCYTGGFSLAAAAWGGAKEVLGIDSSARAIATAQVNAAANGLGNIQFEVGEGFETLQRLGRCERSEVGCQTSEPATHHPSPATLFGAVILDPPKFAHGRSKVDDALRAYYRLNRLALDVLEPGGILVTCSCSGHVSRDDFFQMLMAVAQQSRRDIQILEQRGASADHPVSVTCPETEYLKCFICRVG
jgi:23S rRNA (cytosine1962-C5)-methyltransferase